MVVWRQKSDIFLMTGCILLWAANLTPSSDTQPLTHVSPAVRVQKLKNLRWHSAMNIFWLSVAKKINLIMWESLNKGRLSRPQNFQKMLPLTFFAISQSIWIQFPWKLDGSLHDHIITKYSYRYTKENDDMRSNRKKLSSTFRGSVPLWRCLFHHNVI